MSSLSHPIIAVFGATGQQGGAVVRGLANSNDFHVRAITRRPHSEAAQKLVAEHKDRVELVSADLTDDQSLQKAFTGAWGVYIVTQYWDSSVGDKEEELTVNAAKQALKAGVKFFVFSSMPNSAGLSGGRHPVPQFTGKFKAEQSIRQLPFPEGVSFPYAGMYTSNYLGWLRPQKNEQDGVYEFRNIQRSDVALPMVDLDEEYAAAVVQIFRNPKKYNGQAIYTGTYQTLPQLAEAFSAGTGKAARYVQIPLSASKHHEAVNDMFQYFSNVGYYGGINFEHIVQKTDVVQYWKRHAKEF